jgi:hypothetical protein
MGPGRVSNVKLFSPGGREVHLSTRVAKEFKNKSNFYGEKKIIKISINFLSSFFFLRNLLTYQKKKKKKKERKKKKKGCQQRKRQ